jgi:hypothetical protein
MANGDVTILQEDANGELQGRVLPVASIQNSVLGFSGTNPPVITPLASTGVIGYRTNVASNVATNIPVGISLVQIPFGNVLYDIQSNWQGVTNVWKALSAGPFFFQAQVTLATVATNASFYQLSLMYNNVTIIRTTVTNCAVGQNIPTLCISGMITLPAINDTYGISCVHNDAVGHAVIPGQNTTNFSVHSI